MPSLNSKCYLKKELHLQTQMNIYSQNVELKKPDRRDRILYDSIYVKLDNRQN